LKFTDDGVVDRGKRNIRRTAARRPRGDGYPAHVPTHALAKELEDKYPVTVVGDAFAVGKALDGINAAYKAALEL
jgi:hypothetical protein